MASSRSPQYVRIITRAQVLYGLKTETGVILKMPGHIQFILYKYTVKPRICIVCKSLAKPSSREPY